MAGIGENILGLTRLKRQRDEALANLAEPLRLKLVAPTGSNPGELRMLTYVPPGLPVGAPLVVALHGCTQNAAAYDHGSGWSVLAERHGFAVLFPEQQRSNNPQLCFNWYNPEDVTRGHGEVESIRAMVEQMVRTQQLDPRRVFITGLSAGGAMTAAMLATAPEVFAAGAIIAGLPYASAASVAEAFGTMSRPAHHPARVWGNLVRAASPHTGARPAVQIWHGDDDQTVGLANAEASALQWADALGLPAIASERRVVDGAVHETWRDGQGRPALQRWIVRGLGHGTPITPGAQDMDRAVGIPAPHMLEAPVSSTWELARDWGLLTQPARVRTAAAAAPIGPVGAAGSIIERTLRSAGLMR